MNPCATDLLTDTFGGRTLCVAVYLCVHALVEVADVVIDTKALS